MAGRLKPLDVEREEKHGKYADGDDKNWSYRYWFKGKERWHGLGSFKDVSLKRARLLRDAARLQVRAGVDLVQEKRVTREEKKAEARRRRQSPSSNARKPISMNIGTAGAKSTGPSGRLR